MNPIAEQLETELRRAVPPAVRQLADRLAARAGRATAAVLYYGSALRDEALDGVLDFYVLVDRSADWPGPRLAALAQHLLPPHVGYLEDEIDGRRLRAKFAVMTQRRFRAAMSLRAIDTTLWARFSQPSVCVHARSQADRADVIAALVDAVVTAAQWAAALGPQRGDALAYWRALYAQTYAAELRVERSSRGDDLVARDAQRYARLLPQAWRAARLDYSEHAGGSLQPHIEPQTRARLQRRWALRRRLGRPLNILRLLKAAVTFDNAMDYVAWKIERHAGYSLTPTAFQRRHPLLAAPGLYWRLRRAGVIR